MAELPAVGTDTIRLIRPEAKIARAASAVTAFVGRALKGPVNQPIRIHGFDEYQRVFGGLWQPSMMSYALEQYFENGGRDAIVVRVCNGGRPPSLTLAAGTGTLRLAGLVPGSREMPSARCHRRWPNPGWCAWPARCRRGVRMPRDAYPEASPAATCVPIPTAMTGIRSRSTI